MIINSKDVIDAQKISHKEYKDYDFSLLILQKGEKENQENINT